MKTPYEARTKFGINRLLFGKPRKKTRVFYWVLFLLYMFVAIMFTS